MPTIVVHLGLVGSKIPLQSGQTRNGCPVEVLADLTRVSGMQRNFSTMFLRQLYCPRVLGQWFDGIRFYAAASSPTRSRRTWAGLR